MSKSEMKRRNMLAGRDMMDGIDAKKRREVWIPDPQPEVIATQAVCKFEYLNRYIIPGEEVVHLVELAPTERVIDVETLSDALDQFQYLVLADPEDEIMRRAIVDKLKALLNQTP